MAPDKEGDLYGPQRSIWIRAKGVEAWEQETGKGNLWCLPKIQDSQWKFSLLVFIFTWGICFIDEKETWPNLAWSKSRLEKECAVLTTRLFGKTWLEEAEEHKRYNPDVLVAVALTSLVVRSWKIQVAIRLLLSSNWPTDKRLCLKEGTNKTLLRMISEVSFIDPEWVTVLVEPSGNQQE